MILEGSTNKQHPFEPGEIIIYCDEEYEVIDNYGTSGTVKDAGGDLAKFWWEAYGEVCRRKVTLGDIL